MVSLRNLNLYKVAYKVFKVLGFIDIESLRKEMLTKLKRDILDIGVGDGGDYKYYAKDTKVTVVDFSKKMLEHAKKTVSRDKLKDYKFIHADAADLSILQNNSFDAVVAVFIYCCSVPDSVAALKEAKRVLKKDGQVIIIAHVRSRNKILYFFQRIMEPFGKILMSSMTRDTRSHLEQAGFKIIEERTTGGYDIFKVFRVKPK